MPQFSYDFISKTDRDVQNYTGFKHIGRLTAFRDACVERGVDVEYASMPAPRPAAEVKTRGMVYFLLLVYAIRCKHMINLPLFPTANCSMRRLCFHLVLIEFLSDGNLVFISSFSPHNGTSTINRYWK